MSTTNTLIFSNTEVRSIPLQFTRLFSDRFSQRHSVSENKDIYCRPAESQHQSSSPLPTFMHGDAASAIQRDRP